MKCCIAGTYLVTALICFVVGIAQASRATNATSINSDYEDILPMFENAYDSCAIGEVKIDQGSVKGSSSTTSAGSIEKRFSDITGAFEDCES